MKWTVLACILTVVLKLCSAFPNLFYYDSTSFEGSVCETSDRRQGICRANCTTLTPTQRRDRENICGFEADQAKLCCPRVLFNSSVLYPTIEQACIDREYKLEERLRLSGETKKLNDERARQLRQIVQDYYDLIQKEIDEIVPNCEQEARLIEDSDGQYHKALCQNLRINTILVLPPALYPAKVEEHPHMAALGWTNTDNTTSWSCGGTLIHRSFVLTAAHCIDNIGKPPDLVRVGDVDLRDEADDMIAVDYDIEKIFVHEQYRPPSFYNDIALLKIKKKPEFRYKLRPSPACIWTKDRYPSPKLLLLGYGAPAFGRKHLEKLYKGNLTILDHESCTNYYEPRTDLPNGIIGNQLCAWDLEGKLDTCEGDSGGPLQFNADDRWKTPYLVGITSFGVLCLDGNPGIYTRVHDFLGWIENLMKENQ